MDFLVVIFEHLSDAVCHLMQQCHFDVINYINDIIGIDVSSRIDASSYALCSLLDTLGLTVSEKKLVHPVLVSIVLAYL